MLTYKAMVNMIVGEIEEFFKSLKLVNFASFNDLWKIQLNNEQCFLMLILN